MNIILCHAHELAHDIITLQDHRAAHIIKVIGARSGDRLRMGIINGPQAKATILTTQQGQVTLRLGQQYHQPFTTNAPDLILALPRPIMLKRILSLVATFGVERLFLIRSRRVEKSFFTASLLTPAKIKQRLCHGLEQGGHTRLPEVKIFERFRPFVEDFIPTIAPNYSNKIIAHPGDYPFLNQVFQPSQPAKKNLLAIGPEGGWVDFEITSFQHQGLQPFQMGQAILRVDSAVPALLAQVELLQVMDQQDINPTDITPQ